MRVIVIVLTLLLHGLAGCSKTDDHTAPTTTTESMRAVAELRRLDPTTSVGDPVGWANFTQAGDRLSITVTLRGSGLGDGEHGLHIHTNGDCNGDGTTPGSRAGGHFNPDNRSHGAHAGDLGNIVTEANGNGVRTVLPPDLEAPLVLSDAGTYGILGRSVVVHAGRDDGTTDPSGGSGARVLCGVIIAQ